MRSLVVFSLGLKVTFRSPSLLLKVFAVCQVAPSHHCTLPLNIVRPVALQLVLQSLASTWIEPMVCCVTQSYSTYAPLAAMLLLIQQKHWLQPFAWQPFSSTPSFMLFGP